MRSGDPTKSGRNRKRSRKNDGGSRNDSISPLEANSSDVYDQIATPPKRAVNTVSKSRGTKIIPGNSLHRDKKGKVSGMRGAGNHQLRREGNASASSPRRKPQPLKFANEPLDHAMYQQNTNRTVRDVNLSNSASKLRNNGGGDFLDQAISQQLNSNGYGGNQRPRVASLMSKKCKKRSRNQNPEMSIQQQQPHRNENHGNTVDLLADDNGRGTPTKFANDRSPLLNTFKNNNENVNDPGEELEFHCDSYVVDENDDEKDPTTELMISVRSTPCGKDHGNTKRIDNNLNYNTPTDDITPIKKNKQRLTPGMDVSFIHGAKIINPLKRGKSNKSIGGDNGSLHDDPRRNKACKNIEMDFDQDINNHEDDEIESVSSTLLATEANERIHSENDGSFVIRKYNNKSEKKCPDERSHTKGGRQGCDDGNRRDCNRTEKNLRSILEQPNEQPPKARKKQYGDGVVTVIKSKNRPISKKGNSIEHPILKSRRRLRKPLDRRCKDPRQSSKPAVISIDSSDESDDTGDEIVDDHPPTPDPSPTRTRMETRSRKVVGDRKTVDAVRIAIGGTVFSSGCALQFQPGTHLQFLLLKYRCNRKDGSTNIRYGDDIKIDVCTNTAITEMKYYIAHDSDDEDEEDEVTKVSFIALRVSPNKENNLLKFKKYLSDDEAKKDDPILTDKYRSEMRYIVIEVRKKEQFTTFLDVMRMNEVLNPFMDHAEISDPRVVGQYTVALEKARREEKDAKEKSLLSIKNKQKKRQAAKFSKNNAYSQQPLLVYPFHAPPEIFKAASEMLTVARGPHYSSYSNDDMTNITVATEELDKKDDYSSTVMGRTHLLTINEEDTDRLEPGEYLNDTLIDFWMRWISRGEDAKTTDIHFFTTQFFSKLADEGPSGVASWTAKKNINVFEKKFIFIPVNDSLHWSLCVVINAGKIENAYEFLQTRHDEQRDGLKDAPFILFLDSLKAHKKAKVHKKVTSWLDSEADRLCAFPNLKKPFTQKINQRHVMPIHDPQVPYQDNTWDCGVFICRYAYGTLLLRNQNFTFNDITGDEILQEQITNKSEFTFNMDDIKILRKEMKTLVGNLSKDYQRIKTQENNQRRKAKMAINSKPGFSSGTMTTTSGSPTTTCKYLLANENVNSAPQTEKESPNVQGIERQKVTSNSSLHKTKYSAVSYDKVAVDRLPTIKVDDICYPNVDLGPHVGSSNEEEDCNYVPRDNIKKSKDGTSIDEKMGTLSSPAKEKDERFDAKNKIIVKKTTEQDGENTRPEADLSNKSSYDGEANHDEAKYVSPNQISLIKIESEDDQFDDSRRNINYFHAAKDHGQQNVEI